MSHDLLFRAWWKAPRRIGRQKGIQTMISRHILRIVLLSILFTASALQAKAPPLSADNGIVTIAPMLEQVTPAVVSIAVESQ